MKADTRLFGEIDIQDDKIIKLKRYYRIPGSTKLHFNL